MLEKTTQSLNSKNKHLLIMKTINKLFALFIILLFTACEQKGTLITEINPDGSCSRQIIKKVSVKNMDSYESLDAFVELDSTWKYSWKIVGQNDNQSNKYFPLSEKQIDSIAYDSTSINNKIELTAKKNFPSINDMAKNFKYRRNENYEAWKPTYSFKKKFRWFYTYYEYKEVYPKLKIDFPVSIDKYMTSEESFYWFQGAGNLTNDMTGMEAREFTGNLENKYNEWLGDNYRTYLWNEVVKNYDKIPNPPVSKDKFREMKDSILPLKNFTLDKYPKFSSENQIRNSLNNYFNTTSFDALWQGKDSVMQKSEEKISLMIIQAVSTGKIEYLLNMPGKITVQSTPLMKDDYMKWQLESVKMISGDYELAACSRTTNVWAFILTGLLILFTIWLFLPKEIRIRIVNNIKEFFKH